MPNKDDRKEQYLNAMPDPIYFMITKYSLGPTPHTYLPFTPAYEAGYDDLASDDALHGRDPGIPPEHDGNEGGGMSE